MTDVSGVGISGATGIASGLGKLDTKANLAKAGQQFEAVFDGLMLKAMRKAKLSDTLFESKALDTFRDMQDTRTAQSMAEHAPMGIGKAMTDFLAKAQGSEPAADPASQSDVNPNRAGTSP